MADTAFQQRRNRVLGVTSTSSAPVPVGNSYFQERRKQVLEQSVQPKTPTPTQTVSIKPSQKVIDINKIGTGIISQVKQNPSLIVKGLEFVFKTASNPNQTVRKVTDTLPKQPKQEKPVEVKQQTSSLLDSFKRVTDKTPIKAVKQAVKPYVDAYDIVSGFLEQQKAVGIQRFGQDLPRSEGEPVFQQTKFGPAQPDYKYEPKNKAQAFGKLIYTLGEDFTVWQNGGINKTVDAGMGVIGQSIKASPTIAPKLAFIEQAVTTFASKKFTSFLNKIKPLKITLQDLKDVTAGKGTEEQLIKFEKFNQLRESGMPINEILKAGEKEPLKTRVYDFIKNAIENVTKSLKKSVTPEEQKLLTSGVKKEIDQVIGTGEQTSQEVIGKVINAGLEKTPEGKQIIKVASEAQSSGQNIVINKVEPLKLTEVPKVPSEVKIQPRVESKPIELQQAETVKNLKEARTALKNVKENYQNLITESEAKSAIAQDKRANLNTKAIADLKRIYSVSKKFQEGDIETIRASAHKDLVNGVIEDIQQKYPDMSEQEAFDYALNLPNKSAENIVKGSEFKALEKKQKALDKYIEVLKTKEKDLAFQKDTEFYKEWQQALAMQEKLKQIVEVSRSQLPIGEGKVKASKLEARMKGVLDNASQEDIEKLGLTTYKQMNNKDTLKLASEYVTQNPEEALKVLTGEIQPPKGLNQGSIFTALSNADLDSEMSRKVASLDFTSMGQNIQILKNINKDSPVSTIQDIIDIRERELEKRTGRKVKDLIKSEVEKIKKEVKLPSKTDWGKFLDEIECK